MFLPPAYRLETLAGKDTAAAQDRAALFRLAFVHLCLERSAYAQLNDVSLLDLFLEKLNPRGKIFFYTRSRAFAKTQRIIQDCIQHGKLVQVDEYETLLVYSRTA